MKVKVLELDAPDTELSVYNRAKISPLIGQSLDEGQSTGT
jgi:hypothetical protein